MFVRKYYEIASIFLSLSPHVAIQRRCKN